MAFKATYDGGREPWPEFFEFFIPARIISGPAIINSLAQELAREGCRRPFVITDRGVEAAGVLAKVLAGLASVQAGVEVSGVFRDVRPNSETGIVAEAARQAVGVGADCIMAIGGGSVIDTAKGVNLLVSRGGSLLDWQGVGVIDRPLGKMVAVPTTAGTGSEVTPYAVIKDDATSTKITYVSPYLTPSLAVLDPELTLGLPPRLTASTGLDALTHAVEAYLSTNHNPLSDALALGAVRAIFRWLPGAVAGAADFTAAGREAGGKTGEGHAGEGHGHDAGDPGHLAARYAMLTASTAAGMAFASAMVGIVHAMAHALGGIAGVPHGEANAVLLAAGLRFNAAACPERARELAVAMGRDVAGLTSDEAAAAAVNAVEELCHVLYQACGLPRSLNALGVPEDVLEAVAEAAAVDGAVFTNPRVPEEGEILALLREVYA